ncbi:MAG: hypothetical protein OEV00_01515 [Acidobacteriota bacterium]|nr:hypothetical protein [Acidobacteriota bacterium]MDH3783985.1 hypothetical protein [Acidobacteriota bacterium]
MRLTAIMLALACLPGNAVVAKETLTLRHTVLDLPGAPAKILPADLNDDGRQDLVVVVAYIEVGQVSEDRIEDLISVTTIIPAVFDRREVHVYLADTDGSYSSAAVLQLPSDALHMEAGPPGLPIVVLTDAGLSSLQLETAGDSSALSLVPVLVETPVLANTGDFHADLQLVFELNGDEFPDLLFPTARGPVIFLGNGHGLDTDAADRVDLGLAERHTMRHTSLRYPTVDVRHVNGDRFPDLVLPSLEGSPATQHVWLGSQEGSFRPIRVDASDCHDRLTDIRLDAVETDASPWPVNLVALEDLDGDGRAEAILSDLKDRGDGMRSEMKDAKRPLQTYRFHRLTDDLKIAAEPYFETEVMGHTASGDASFEVSRAGANLFEDLDGDGRKDLVTLTLDFSLLQVLKVMVAKRISIGLDFHVYAQDESGQFKAVPGLDLSEKLKLNLNNLVIGRFAQFAGDFDGDGRQDFAHFGRGKTLTLHRGQPGCVYPTRPDLTILLEDEPASLDLVRVEDLDGDGRSDIRVTRPGVVTDPDASAPVRVDLYLSGDKP